MEQRRRLRYKFEFPLDILKVGQERVHRSERTRDISSGGVCFVSADDVEIGCPIEYVITLASVSPLVRIHCLGNVLRVTKQDEREPFQVAVTMDRYEFFRASEPGSMTAIA